MSAVVYIPVAAYIKLVDLWQSQMANVKAKRGPKPVPYGVMASEIMDASERPIMTGIVADVHHDKVE